MTLIEPFLADDALLRQISGTAPEPGQVACWWLGQSGLLLKSRHAVVLIDPYLSEHLTAKYKGTTKEHTRMTRCPVRPEALTMVDYLLTSHKHSDHMDPGTLPALLAASPGAKLIVPQSLVGHAVSMGLKNHKTIGLDHDLFFEDPAKNLKIRGVKAAHEGLDRDELGRHLYLSFVIELDGLKIFHSGDTIPWPGQAAAVGSGVDLAFLPINGRDTARGVPGNMTAEEAVDFAASISARHVVPHHYEMFTFNTVDPDSFRKAAGRLPEGVKPVILRCGERFIIR